MIPCYTLHLTISPPHKVHLLHDCLDEIEQVVSEVVLDANASHRPIGVSVPWVRPKSDKDARAAATLRRAFCLVCVWPLLQVLELSWPLCHFALTLADAKSFYSNSCIAATTITTFEQ